MSPDWLSSLASGAASVGSFIGSAIRSTIAPDIGSFDINRGNQGVVDLTHGAMAASGTAMSAVSDKDPTKLITGPFLSGLHDLGVGQQGDDWDKGLIGIIGSGFQKAGDLATYTALATSGSTWSNPVSGMARFDPTLNQKAWDMAFNKNAPVDFGAAVLAGGSTSVLTDPNGLANLHGELNSTWYGNIAAGAVTMAMYAAVDPTKGLGKATEASQAAKYVTSPIHADQLAGAINDVGTAFPEKTLGGTLGNTGRALVGQPLNIPAQAGYLMKSMERFNNDTDLNSVMAKLDPTHGEGTTATRSALPVMAEQIRDAGNIADPMLQAQTKTNIFLAASGSSESMKWLADNSPMIAAKGRRVAGIPSEFTLLQNVMDDVQANGLQSLDMGQWVDSHYGNDANAVELKAYASKVEQVRQFQQTINQGDEGNAVQFGTSGKGTLVAPRALDSLKAGLNKQILDSHLLQDGPSGRTIRIVNSVVTPQTNRLVATADPILGNKQLMSTIQNFNNKLRDVPTTAFRKGSGPDAFDSEYTSALSESYLKATPAERGAIVDNLGDAMLQKVAEKYSPESNTHRGAPLTPENVQQLIRESNAAKTNGRAYSLAKVQAAQAAGEGDTYLGDMSGADTVIDTAHLSSQLDTTRPLWDWNSANDIVSSFYRDNGVTSSFPMSDIARSAGDRTLSGIARYHRIWKNAVLFRPGLATRAIEDTGLRSAVTVGAQSTALQALTGAYYTARHVGQGLLGNSFDEARMTLTDADKANALRIQGSIDTLGQEGADQAVNVMGRQLQSNRAGELAASLRGKARTNGRFNSMTNYYNGAADRAVNLQTRMAGDSEVFGGGKPLGAHALLNQFGEDAAARRNSIVGLTGAKARYELGSPNRLSNASMPFTEKGYTFQAVKSDMEYAALKTEAQAAGTAADMYTSQMSTNLKNMRLDAASGSENVAANDAHWAQTHAATASTLRSSYTAKRMMNEQEGFAVKAQTPDAIVKSYLTDPQAIAEYRAQTLANTKATTIDRAGNTVPLGTPVQVRGEHLGSEGMKSWLSQLNNSVRSMTPSPEALDLLRGAKDVTPEMSNKIAAADRFPIFGPNVFHDQTPAVIDNIYNVLLNLPDVHLARVPMFNGLYRSNVKSLLNDYIDRATAQGRDALTDTEQQAIHLRAKGLALNDVRRDMYDVHRSVGAHGVMAVVSPFFMPWEDAMMSWGRLIYEDPSRIGLLMRASNTGDMFHVTTDKSGNPTQPFDGTGMQDKYINIPLGGLGGLQSMRANVGSFNSIQQGNVPFSPGVGPLVQLSATAIVGLGLTHTGTLGANLWNIVASHPDNIVSQSLLPQGGVPKADLNSLVGSQLPSYMKKLSDAVFGSSPMAFGNVYATAFGTRYGDLITQYRTKNGGRDPSKAELVAMQGQADSGARAAAIASAAMSFGIGISGNAAPEGQLYVDKMHALNAMTPALAAQGVTPAGVFAVMYPNAARLNWSFSQNDGKLEATVNATSAYLKYKTIMAANPSVDWWIAGPDNLLANLGTPNAAGATFSQSAYNQQMTDSLRRTYTKDELIQQQDISMGYGKMAQFDSTLALYMRQNGIKSLNDKNAGSLSVLKDNYTQQLRDQFPQWAVYADSVDTKKTKESIDSIQALVTDPKLTPSLANRPDVLTTQKYLYARQQVENYAASQGVVNWQTSKTQLANRYALWQYGQTLAAGDVVFQQAWSRLFVNEFKKDLVPTADPTATAAAPAVTPGN
jgi:hypothetical protein